MRRLFLRIYVALGLVLLVSAAVVLALAPSADLVELDQQIEALTGITPDAVAARFTEGARHDEVAAALAEELGHPVAVLPEAAVVGSVGDFARRNLAQGEAVVQLHDAGPAIYVPIPSQPFVTVLRPGPAVPPWTATRGLALAVLVLLGVGGAVFAVVRPVERQLESITAAADRIGGGDLSARADVSREDAAGRLAGSFNAMAEQVQSMVDGRKALLHGVSHELRTPLTRLRFAVELLSGEYSAAELRKRTQAALGDVEDLEEMVSELLRYAQLEGGAPLQMSLTDLVELVSELVAEARRLRPEVEVAWEAGELAPFELDRRLVHRSIGNLLTNAVRYADGRVAVSMVVDDGGVRVRVDDDGPGVPPEQRDRIFDPFVRLDVARSRDTGGAGLGLALARRAARAHGGDVIATDGELGGARFEWTVPRSTTPDHPEKGGSLG